MDSIEFKRRLLETGLLRKATNGWYRCQTCPYCGDTKWHMYLFVDIGRDSPVGYNCFKCHQKGLLKQDWLDYFGINLKVPYVKGRRRMQPNSTTEMIDDLIDPEKHSETIALGKEYIERRLGVIPTFNDLKAFQLVGDPAWYVRSYLDNDTWGLKDRIWFRMHNGGIAGRALSDNTSLRWRKRTPPNVVGGLYTVKCPVNTEQMINVCVCEGVVDAIGLYYHNFLQNAVYIACMGSDYVKGVSHALDMGVFGDSVCINVFKDSDVNRVVLPKSHTQLFRSVTVYRNSMAKDFGVKKEQIDLEKESYKECVR